MYRLVQIENKEGFSSNLLDNLKQCNEIKLKKISDTLLELRSNNFTHEFLSGITKLNNIITYDNFIYEIQDIDLFEFYYCSGQEIPDTSIDLSKSVELNLENYFNIQDYCPKCKLGLIQNQPLSFKGNLKKVCKNKFVTPFWSYWLISKELKNNLEETNLTGINYLKVFNTKNEIFDDVFQIKPSVVIYNSILEECFIPRKKYSKCNCSNYTYVFKNLNNILMKRELKNELQDFTELYEKTERIKGAYILSKKFIHELVKNGLYPDKHYQIWPVSFV